MKLQNVRAIFLKQTVETSIKLKMIETDKLSLFFSNEFPFNKEGLAEFANTFVKKFYKKGEVILKVLKIGKDWKSIDDKQLNALFDLLIVKFHNVVDKS